jgi:hypothetical protein
MATKLDVQKTTQARQQMEFQDAQFWKPRAGNGSFEANFVRILPPHDKMEGKLFQPVALHWMPDRTAYICPRRMMGGNCPLCQKGFEINKLGDKEGARKFWPNWAAYMNVLVLNKDGTLADEKVKLWSANRDVTDLLLELVQEVGDFTDVDEGRNLMVKAKKTSEGGFDKYDYIIQVSPKQTALPRPEVLEELHDPTTVNPLLSAPDMQRLVHMLIEGPGAERADPLALPAASEQPADEWEEPAQPPASSEVSTDGNSGDEWGSDPASPGEDPTNAKPKRTRKAVVQTAEDIEAQKQRLRDQLK